MKALERTETLIGIHQFHAVYNRNNDTFVFIIAVNRYFFRKITGKNNLLKCILPRIVSFSVLGFIGIVEVKNSAVRKIFQIRTDLIIAAIDIITAFIRGIQRIIADRIEDSAHCRKLLIRIYDIIRTVCKVASVSQHKVNAFHQLIRKHQADRHNQIHTDNNKNRFEHSAENLTVCHFHFIVKIKQLFDNRDNREYKNQDNSDCCHSDINSVCNRI